LTGYDHQIYRITNRAGFYADLQSILQVFEFTVFIIYHKLVFADDLKLMVADPKFDSTQVVNQSNLVAPKLTVPAFLNKRSVEGVRRRHRQLAPPDTSKA